MHAYRIFLLSASKIKKAGKALIGSVGASFRWRPSALIRDNSWLPVKIGQSDQLRLLCWFWLDCTWKPFLLYHILASDIAQICANYVIFFYMFPAPQMWFVWRFLFETGHTHQMFRGLGSGASWGLFSRHPDVVNILATRATTLLYTLFNGISANQRCHATIQYPPIHMGHPSISFHTWEWNTCRHLGNMKIQRIWSSSPGISCIMWLCSCWMQWENKLNIA